MWMTQHCVRSPSTVAEDRQGARAAHRGEEAEERAAHRGEEAEERAAHRGEEAEERDKHEHGVQRVMRNMIWAGGDQ